MSTTRQNNIHLSIIYPKSHKNPEQPPSIPKHKSTYKQNNLKTNTQNTKSKPYRKTPNTPPI